ncbi:MAG: DUF2812 domain-containing protein [Oscillospiraceae bacterium]|nr:DUF2812 domain-containing protein [Oscillospiraceae bacterium]MBR2929156.1 DUF2812 domain-containing protein [Oscillospiraceae bacterium]
MRRVIRKAFFIWNFREEEKWINEMSEQGLHLVDAGRFRYVFEEGEPGAYRYRLELLQNYPSHAESADYIAFMEETGAEYVDHVDRWVYFRKKAADGEFDLYSDINSRIDHVGRILTLIRILAVVEGICVVMELLAGFVGHVEAARPIAGFLACFEVLLLMGWKKVKAIHDGLVRERAIRE